MNEYAEKWKQSLIVEAIVVLLGVSWLIYGKRISNTSLIEYMVVSTLVTAIAVVLGIYIARKRAIYRMIKTVCDNGSLTEVQQIAPTVGVYLSSSGEILRVTDKYWRLVPRSYQPQYLGSILHAIDGDRYKSLEVVAKSWIDFTSWQHVGMDECPVKIEKNGAGAGALRAWVFDQKNVKPQPTWEKFIDFVDESFARYTDRPFCTGQLLRAFNYVAGDIAEADRRRRSEEEREHRQRIIEKGTRACDAAAKK